MTPRHMAPRAIANPQSKVVLSDDELKALHDAEVAALPLTAQAARAEVLAQVRADLVAKREKAQAQYNGLLDKFGKPRRPKLGWEQAYAAYEAQVTAHQRKP